jgi:predicted P-loop ATPase
MSTTLAQTNSTRPVCRTYEELAAWRSIDISILKTNCHRTEKCGGGWEFGNRYSTKNQVMPDVPTKDDKGRERKYLCQPGANNFDIFIPLYPGIFKSYFEHIPHNGIAYITEGNFKAMKACESDILCFSIPGIYNFQYQDENREKYLMPSIMDLKNKGIHTIVIAYDADCLTNPDIHKASILFAEVLIANGFGAKIATGAWNPEDGKGMDDAISKNGAEWMRERLERALTLDAYRDKYQPVIEKAKSKGERDRNQEGGKLSRQYDAFKAFYGDRVRLNTLKGEIEVDKKDFDIASAKLRVSRDLSFDINLTDSQQFFRELASENKYDPFIEFLDQCGASLRSTKDVTDLLSCDIAVLESALTRKIGEILRLDDKLSLSFVVKTIVAIVRRSREPGCQHRTVLIFHGTQNIGKSMFWRTLAGDEFFGDDYLGTNDKDDIMRLHRKRVHEISEIDSVYKKSDAAQLKANISRQVDLLRLPYAPTTKEVPRSTVIVASTNAHDPLRDPTGDTRFWMVHLHEKVDLELLKRERKTIWAIADILYAHGYETFLDDSQQALSDENNKAYRDTEQVDEILLAWLQLTSFDNGWRSPVTLQEAMDIVYPDMTGKVGTRNDQRRVTDALRRIGYEPSKKKMNGKTTAVWVRIPTVTVPPVQLPHGNPRVTIAGQGFEPTVTVVTAASQTLLNLENEESNSLLLQPVTLNSVEFEVESGNAVTNAQIPLAATVTLGLPCGYSSDSTVTVNDKQPATAINKPAKVDPLADLLKPDNAEFFSNCVLKDFTPGMEVEIVSNSFGGNPGTKRGSFLFVESINSAAGRVVLEIPPYTQLGKKFPPRSLQVLPNQIKPVK